MKNTSKETTERARFRSTNDFKLKPTDMEQPKGKSLTVPDDTYTVQELLERHARGLPLAGRAGEYLEDSDIEDDDLEAYNRMDITERHERAEEAGLRIRTEKQAKEKKAKEEAETEQRAFSEWKKQPKKNVQQPENEKNKEKNES